MSVNINRMNKAMHRVDPDGDYRWYINTDNVDVTLEVQWSHGGVAIQICGEIYGHKSRYDEFFQKLKDKMDKLKEVLLNEIT